MIEIKKRSTMGKERSSGLIMSNFLVLTLSVILSLLFLISSIVPSVSAEVPIDPDDMIPSKGEGDTATDTATADKKSEPRESWRLIYGNWRDDKTRGRVVYQLIDGKVKTIKIYNHETAKGASNIYHYDDDDEFGEVFRDSAGNRMFSNGKIITPDEKYKADNAFSSMEFTDEEMAHINTLLAEGQKAADSKSPMPKREEDDEDGDGVPDEEEEETPEEPVIETFGRGLYKDEDGNIYTSQEDAKKGENPIGKCTSEKCDRVKIDDADVNIDANGNVYDSKKPKKQVGRRFRRTGFGFEYEITSVNEKGRHETTGRMKFFVGKGANTLSVVEWQKGEVEKGYDPDDADAGTVYYHVRGEDGKTQKFTLEQMEERCKGAFAVDYSDGSYYCDGTRIHRNGAIWKESGYFNRDYSFTDSTGKKYEFTKCAANFCKDKKGNIYDVRLCLYSSGECVPLSDEDQQKLFSDGLVGTYGMFHFGTSLDYWVGITTNRYSGLASLFYDKKSEDDFFGLMDSEYMSMVLGGMDSWTSFACLSGVQGAGTSGMAFAFSSGQSFAHIEGERITFINYSSQPPKEYYLYKITFEVNPYDCDMEFNAYIDDIALFSRGWDLVKGNGTVAYTGSNTFYDWSERIYSEVCINFKYVKANCLAGVSSGEGVCNKIVDGVTTGDYEYAKKEQNATSGAPTSNPTSRSSRNQRRAIDI